MRAAIQLVELMTYSQFVIVEIFFMLTATLKLYFRLIIQDSSGSELDDVGNDCIPEISDHDIDTDLSDAEPTTQPLSWTENISKPSSEDRMHHFLGSVILGAKANKYMWSKAFLSRASVRIPQHILVPSSTLTENDGKDLYNIWKQYLDDDIMLEILTRTNSILSEYEFGQHYKL
ncbi:hypothetical protein HHI36_012988 [Cryptolaemus montrouzieri]|uniref:Uncharacterized protein n=1 Tax=Cryptolaemus montrouzieri TaxID=559131 RepID=A0ABD2NFV9_9CUCU